MRTTYLVYTLLLLVAASPLCHAADQVFGPPKLLVDARIEQDAGRQGKQFVASFLSWDESQQSWDQSRTLSGAEIPTAFHGRNVSVKRSRAVIVLQSERFVAPMDVLAFSTLDGDPVELSRVPAILEGKRAVAFVTKGCTIHPAIAAALHPETLVVSRKNHREDPILIPLPATR